MKWSCHCKCAHLLRKYSAVNKFEKEKEDLAERAEEAAGEAVEEAV